MAGEKINEEYITEYLHEVLPKSDGILYELEEYAKENDVPIIHREVKAMLEVLCKLKKPERILEIGTAIGYSATVFAKATSDDTKIVTIERDPEMTEKALSNIERAGLSHRIRVIEDEAERALSCLDSKFDLIFIDAAKGYYNEFFAEVLRLVSDEGLIISDNVLYKGMTATDDLVKRRQKTIVGRMRKYLDMLCNHPNLTSSIIPIGDGVALSWYKE